ARVRRGAEAESQPRHASALPLLSHDENPNRRQSPRETQAVRKPLAAASMDRLLFSRQDRDSAEQDGIRCCAGVKCLRKLWRVGVTGNFRPKLSAKPGRMLRPGQLGECASVTTQCPFCTPEAERDPKNLARYLPTVDRFRGHAQRDGNQLQAFKT